ncbi:hypothetical protein IV203_025119 [Nitzschia inconspicua]|uniref:Uncharacterized protein n=1 Tax=Nitzschia inconspicua TaxID=303405 RepID=A0A9K3K6N9_9STRA|nr:hypothetical protein IV203_002612 [Nitzschia inconspicua]KAG7339545.1 hypothetical protein IV203_025138 [Nitzschia inconspicua]KAG7359353.1 hypothetical protein IV203_034451 [Nitzschia inconspicua]KAG7365678.1 hypothetical protein IV203_025119 [Nitzschia inconspicua]
MACLRTGLKKPGTMSPKEFATLLEMANEYVKLIPGAPVDSAGLTPNEFCRAYLNAMPRQWPQNFTNAGKKCVYGNHSIDACLLSKHNRSKIPSSRKDHQVVITSRREITVKMDVTTNAMPNTATVTKAAITITTTGESKTPTKTITVKVESMPIHPVLYLTITDTRLVNVALSVMPSDQVTAGTTRTTPIATQMETSVTTTVLVVMNPTSLKIRAT